MKAVGKTLGIALVAFSLAFAITAANIAADRGAAALRQAEAQAAADEGVPVVVDGHAITLRSERPRMKRGVASAYGPGLWGNTVGCRPYPRLREHMIGIAAKPETARCGAVLQVCERRARRCVQARVIDRGPYVHGRTLDLTEAMVRRFGVSGWRAWGVRDVRYRCVRRCS